MSELETTLLQLGAIVVVGIVFVWLLARSLSRPPKRGDKRSVLCNHCWKLVVVRGVTERCPRCGGEWPVPSAAVAPQLAYVPQKMSAEARARAEEKTTAILAVMAVAGLVAGFIALIYVQNLLVSVCVGLFGATIGGVVGKFAGSMVQSATQAVVSKLSSTDKH